MFLHPHQIPTRTIRAVSLILTRRTLLLRPSHCPAGPQHRATSASINHSPVWFRPSCARQDSRHFSTAAKMPPLETRENTGTQRRIVIVGGVAGSEHQTLNLNSKTPAQHQLRTTSSTIDTSRNSRSAYSCLS